MRVNECIHCSTFPCQDVRHDCYIVPDLDVTSELIRLVMISEAAPTESTDYFYADKGDPLFLRTTLQAFQDAGVKVSSLQGLLNMGVYLTTAIKCGKMDYLIKATTINECSKLLEREIALFPYTQVFMLMGDVAKKALNYIARRQENPRVIPAGSTYKIRNQVYFYKTSRVFPSYLQAGRSFLIEKSKRRMIAEDIRLALNLIKY